MMVVNILSNQKPIVIGKNESKISNGVNIGQLETLKLYISVIHKIEAVYL